MSQLSAEHSSHGGVPHDELSNHNYDGIQEYDNPTPRWWTWIFVITFVFGMLYLVVFLFSDGASPQAFYERDYAEALKAQYGQLGNIQPDEPTLVRLMHDEKWNHVGAAIFQSNCVTCHGVDASGVAGPNLTDEYYIHVRKITDFADVIANGRKSGAMPAWKERLQPVEQVLVAAYVASLRGQNKPSIGGRPHEGEKIAPWPEK